MAHTTMPRSRKKGKGDARAPFAPAMQKAGQGDARRAEWQGSAHPPVNQASQPSNRVAAPKPTLPGTPRPSTISPPRFRTAPPKPTTSRGRRRYDPLRRVLELVAYFRVGHVLQRPASSITMDAAMRAGVPRSRRRPPAANGRSGRSAQPRPRHNVQNIPT